MNHVETVLAGSIGAVSARVMVATVVEEEPLGTAGPVRLAYDEGVLEERLLVLNGDVLTATGETRSCNDQVTVAAKIFSGSSPIL